MIHWTQEGQAQQALWRSESGASAPRRVEVVDDTLSADAAYRMACEGTALLWQGDFQNARHLLQALMRRADRKPRKSAAKASQKLAAATPAEAFHLHRQAQAQRARVLASVLIPLESDYGIGLRRAPDWRLACTEAWGPATGERTVATLRELLGLVGAHEWRKKGVEVPALGAPPNNRIHPHYGVFSPVRGEYVELVANAPLPGKALAFDIGVGTGVLSAVLVRRGVQRVVATDQDPRALACALDNLRRLGVLPQPAPAPVSAPHMPTALRDAALREDWRAWADAWTALDAGPVADLLRRAEGGTPVQLTLCGERGALAFHTAPRSLAQRFTSLFRPQRFMDVRNQL